MTTKDKKDTTIVENTTDAKYIVENTTDAKYDALSSFVSAVINKDNSTAEEFFSNYAGLKSKDILGVKAVTEDVESDEDDADEPDEKIALKNRDKKKKPLKKMKVEETVVNEDSNSEEDEDEDDEDEDDEAEVALSNRDKKKPALRKMKMEEGANPISMKGKDVYANGKQVGSIKNDLSKLDAGISFTSVDGKKSSKHENIKKLYQHLMKEYNIKTETALDDESTESDDE